MNKLTDVLFVPNVGDIQCTIIDRQRAGFIRVETILKHNPLCGGFTENTIPELIHYYSDVGFEYVEGHLLSESLPCDVLMRMDAPEYWVNPK